MTILLEKERKLQEYYTYFYNMSSMSFFEIYYLCTGYYFPQYWLHISFSHKGVISFYGDSVFHVAWQYLHSRIFMISASEYKDNDKIDDMVTFLIISSLKYYYTTYK